MDRVPSVFRERVADLWKCCDDLECGGCHIRKKIPDCEWTRISRKRRIEFYGGSVDGKWKYGFGDPEEIYSNRALTMDELKNSPGLKNVVICKITVSEKWMDPVMAANLRPLDVDMEVLMKFVLFLSNEPVLDVWRNFSEPSAPPEGSTLLNFLQEMQFSGVYFSCYKANYNRLLQRQYSWRKATQIDVMSIESGKEFLEAELSAVRLQKCHNSKSLSTHLLDAIVARFLEDPGQFGEDYEVTCHFEPEKTMNILREMKETTRFVRECVNQNTESHEFAVEGAHGKVLIIRQHQNRFISKGGSKWTLLVSA